MNLVAVRPECTRAEHADIMDDPIRMMTRTMWAGWFDVGDALLELRNCNRCRSTISRQVDPVCLAQAYASALRPGCTIHEQTDANYIAPFRAWLPGELARMGLCLDQVPGGFRVRETNPQRQGA